VFRFDQIAHTPYGECNAIICTRESFLTEQPDPPSNFKVEVEEC